MVKKIINPNDIEAKKIAAKLGYRDEDLFDYSEEPEGGIYNLPLNDFLSESEIEEAISLMPLFRGFMLVTGEIGAGKDLWGNTISWKRKYFIKGTKVLRDDRPRPAFGSYIPFNEDILLGELKQIDQLSRITPTTMDDIRDTNKKSKRLKDVVSNWWEESGKILLENSVLYMTEFKKYCHNRDAMNPMGITISHIATQQRHYDILIIGTTPQRREIDRISILPYVTHEVKCSWMQTREDTTKAKVFFTKWLGSKGVLSVRGKPKIWYINGKEPREYLGGKGFYSLWNSKSKTRLKTR